MSARTSVLPYEQRPTNRDLSHLDGEDGWPVVGKSLAMFRDPHAMFSDHHRRFGDISRISIAGDRSVVFCHPDHVQRIMLDREKNFSCKMGWQQIMADFFQGGLVMRDYAEHRLHRGIMQTAFKPDAMRVYLENIRHIVERNVERWAAAGEVNFYAEVKRQLLDIAFDVFCWVDDSESVVPKINRAFTNMMEGSLAIVRKDWPGLLYRRGLNGRRYLKNFFLSLVEQKRASDDQDVFAHFCRERQENGEYYDSNDIADHMVFLMLAAHDTTTSATTMAAYYLAQEREVQDELREEARQAEWPFTYESIFRSMEKMVCAFYETIRLHPPVPLLMRRSIRETDFDGVRIPADTMVLVPTMHIQRLPGWWDEPNRFKPERFAEGVTEHRKHQFMWMPFGGGAHKCIGMHFARLLFLSTFTQLLRSHKIEFAKSDYFPTKVQHFPFSKPADGLPLRIRRV